jgi:hypothetical protein
MKNSDEKPKRDFPKDLKPIARVPKEWLQDCGNVKLEYVGELTPKLLKEIFGDGDLLTFKVKKND